MCELWLDRSVWARLLQLEREDVDRVFVCGRALQARRSRVSRIEALQRKGPQEMAKKRHSRAVMGARLRLPVITLEALAPGVGLIFSGSIKKPGRKLLFSRSLLPESLANFNCSRAREIEDCRTIKAGDVWRSNFRPTVHILSKKEYTGVGHQTRVGTSRCAKWIRLSMMGLFS